MRSKHRFDVRQYVVAVTHGSKTRYFYGRHLKDALAAAGKAIPDDYPFTYARFERKSITQAEKHGTRITSFA